MHVPDRYRQHETPFGLVPHYNVKLYRRSRVARGDEWLTNQWSSLPSPSLQILVFFKIIIIIIIFNIIQYVYVVGESPPTTMTRWPATVTDGNWWSPDCFGIKTKFRKGGGRSHRWPNLGLSDSLWRRWPRLDRWWLSLVATLTLFCCGFLSYR